MVSGMFLIASPEWIIPLYESVILLKAVSAVKITITVCNHPWLLVSTALCSPLPYGNGLVFMIKSRQHKWWHVTSQIGWPLSLCPSGDSLWGNHGMSYSIERPVWQETKVFSPQPWKQACKQTPFHIRPVLVCVPQHNSSDGLSLPWLGYKRLWSTRLLAHHSLWENCVICSSMKRPLGPRTEVYCHQSVAWVHMEMHLTTILKSPKTMTPATAQLESCNWSRTTQLSFSQIPDAQIPYETTQYCFKLLRFWLTCYTETNN